MKVIHKELLEEMAVAGYERMFDDKWDNLQENSIEKALWLEIAKAMLKSVRFPKELMLLCQELILTPNKSR